MCLREGHHLAGCRGICLLLLLSDKTLLRPLPGLLLGRADAYSIVKCTLIRGMGCFLLLVFLSYLCGS